MAHPLRLTCAAGIAVLCTRDALAQDSTLQVVAPLKAGSCAIVVTSDRPLAPTHLVQVRLSGEELPARPPIGADRTVVAFGLKGPLKEDDAIQVREVGAGLDTEWGAKVMVVKGDGAVECRPIKLESDDPRTPFEATAYLGRVFDNFSPSEIGHYATTAPKTENNRAIYGIDFGGRVWSSRDGRRQFWLVGETLNGVRSADVDCRDRNDDQGQPLSKPPACEQFSGLPGNTTNSVQNAVYITEHATSLEAYVEPRFEFLTLRAGLENRAVLFARAVLGVMMVDDGKDHAASAHDIGGGFEFTAGPFSGSHLAAGWGRTDLFVPTGTNDQPGQTQRGRWNRLKVDGLLVFSPARMLGSAPGLSKVPRIFIQVYSDFDPLGTDADSVQTFMGMELNIAEFFK
ncbi:MAG TPA: hypothetical protein VKB50_09260 [Vicinamibacterales bacterium]|nr:hypothetical protein [Vicinamibacterales bacterium]